MWNLGTELVIDVVHWSILLRGYSADTRFVPSVLVHESVDECV